MLLIYNIEIKQCNGVYILTTDLDNDIIKLSYNSVNSKLN